ncbi:Uncharacterised protein [Escherichia coli]|nr:Uncharacterised protein [Escherichia coli]
MLIHGFITQRDPRVLLFGKHHCTIIGVRDRIHACCDSRLVGQFQTVAHYRLAVIADHLLAVLIEYRHLADLVAIHQHIEANKQVVVKRLFTEELFSFVIPVFEDRFRYYVRRAG